MSVASAGALEPEPLPSTVIAATAAAARVRLPSINVLRGLIPWPFALRSKPAHRPLARFGKRRGDRRPSCP